MLGIDDYTIYPCRGEYFVLDKKCGPMLPLPAYPVPNYKTGGLGIHLTPTTDGNLLVGPSTEYIDENDDYSATRSIMDLLIEDGSRIFPYLKREYFIRNFSGIRPKLSPKGVGGYHDFVIERRDDTAPNAINLVGIESPGLTSALPIAREVARLIGEIEPLAENPSFDPRREKFATFADKSPEEQQALIAENPDYGEIVCRCESVTKAEILAAIRNPLGVDSVTGVKYRCRAGMGRCQGGSCRTRIAELIMREKNKNPEEILYSRKGSYLYTGCVRA
jgi:glycerol-3-phosphate dehydrogenase